MDNDKQSNRSKQTHKTANQLRKAVRLKNKLWYTDKSLIEQVRKEQVCPICSDKINSVDKIQLISDYHQELRLDYYYCNNRKCNFKIRA